MASDNKNTLQALKEKFVTGLIPNETDFSDLINLANSANTALGLSEDGNSSAPLNGLHINDQHVLEVKLVEESGLIISDKGLGVKAGSGVTVDSNGVSIKVSSGQGIEVSEQNIIQVKPWPGVELVNNELTLKVSKGLKLGDNGIELNIGSGLKTTDKVLDVNIAALGPTNKSGLINTTEGLKINLATQDNSLTINDKGELTLTTDAINSIKAGSKSKFVTALDKTVKNAIDNKKVPNDTTEPLGATEDWDAPITRLVNTANAFGQNAVINARDKLEEKIKKYIDEKEQKKDVVRPTNDNLRINFSYIKQDFGLYYGSEYFTLDTLASFWSEEGNINYQDNNFNSDYGISASNFVTPGFYAFAGKLTAPGQTAKNDANGQHLTANAIMVYISNVIVYTVGYWDLSTEPLEFYQFESEPMTNEETRKSVNLVITSPAPKEISAIHENNFLNLNITGGNGSVKKFAIKDPNNNGLTVDDKGVLNFTKWSETATIVTVSESSTRTKNAATSIDVPVKIDPIKTEKLTGDQDTHFKLEQHTDHEFNLYKITHGRDKENNIYLPLKFKSNNTSIVTVDTDGDFKILNHGPATSITVTQEKTPLHHEKSYDYKVDVDANEKPISIRKVLFSSWGIRPINTAICYIMTQRTDLEIDVIYQGFMHGSSSVVRSGKKENIQVTRDSAKPEQNKVEVFVGEDFVNTVDAAVFSFYVKENLNFASAEFETGMIDTDFSGRIEPD